MKTAFVFDLDGTITQEEILPRISAEIGLKEEIGLLTQLTLDGRIPFSDSFKLRCAILKSVRVSRVQEIVRDVKLFPNLEQFISKNRACCFINTGNLDVWISPIASRLGCHLFSSKADSENDSLKGIKSILNKGDSITHIKKDFDRVVAIGDSFNDIPMFEGADICIAFGGTHEPIAQLREISDFVVYEEGSLCRMLNMLL